jgi:ATP-dependent helicase IRC3
VQPPTQHATRTLILAHRRELVEQAARHCQNLYADKTVEIEMGNQHATGCADITVASVQSIVSGDRILRYDPKTFKLVMVDEAHHIVAPRYLDVLKHFKLLGEDPRGDTALVGVSATFSRFDGLKLGTAIDHIVYHKDYVDMIDDGWLSKAIFTTVQSNVNLSGVKTSNGDFQTAALAKAVNTPETNLLTIRTWLERASHRKSTLVFCVDLDHVASINAEFRQHGVNARFVTSDTPAKVRAERLESFKKGEYPVLVNCGIFTEGTDIPNVDCVLLARPTQSRNLLVQMIGRGLRLSSGKENCHVIDMVASLATGVVTTPTLFGLDPQEIIDNADFKQIKDIRERRELEQEREAHAFATTKASDNSRRQLTGEVVFTDYDSVTDLIEDTSGERHIRALSPFAWVQIDESKYMLSSRNGDYLTLKGDGDEYVVIFTRKLPYEMAAKAPFARPQQVATAQAFENGVRAADKFASEMFPFEFINKNAPWRRGPASPGQLQFLNKFRDDDDQLAPAAINKGKAGDWITKLKHGARGRFTRIEGQKRKTQRLVDKKDQWKERQQQSQVTVGPVVG